MFIDLFSPEDFKQNYCRIFEGNSTWQNFEIAQEKLYSWKDDSTYIKEVLFFRDISAESEPLKDITDARVLFHLRDSVTTDHISPAVAFSESSSSEKYLVSRGVDKTILIHMNRAEKMMK